MENNTFVTETDPKYIKHRSIKTLIIIFLVFSLLACLGFLISWQLFVFLELIAVISCVVVFFQNTKNAHLWRREFENDVLTITDLSINESYLVFDI